MPNTRIAIQMRLPRDQLADDVGPRTTLFVHGVGLQVCSR